FAIPLRSVSGENGTTILCVHSTSLRPLALVASMAKSHVPLSDCHSARRSCGRGYPRPYLSSSSLVIRTWSCEPHSRTNAHHARRTECARRSLPYHAVFSAGRQGARGEIFARALVEKALQAHFETRKERAAFAGERAVARTPRHARANARRNDHVSWVPGQIGQRRGEILPCYGIRVRDVPEATFTIDEQVETDRDQARHVRRRHHLGIVGLDRISASPLRERIRKEIVIVPRAEERARPDDQRRRQHAKHAPFGFGLAAAVGIQRRRRVALDIRRNLLSAKDEVARERKKPRAVEAAHLGEVGRTFDVLAEAAGQVAFGVVDAHIASGIDDGPWLVAFERPPHR